MQVILHTGVQFTDEGRLERGLRRNAELLAASGVAVPPHSRYRTLLSEAAHSLAQAEAAPDAREVMLGAILEEDPPEVDRMILSHEHLFGVPKLALQGGVLYRKAEDRVGTVKELFRGDRLELVMGLRNPATWLPAAFRDVPQPSFMDFMSGLEPDRMRWSDLIKRLRAAHPDVPITVWCNEDTPLIWGELIREIGALESTRKIRGAFDLLAEIMEPEGMKRFRAYLAGHPGITERQKRRVMVAFLDKYALDEAIEEELDLPGWDEAYVERLTTIYEEDLWEIERLPGVTVLST